MHRWGTVVHQTVKELNEPRLTYARLKGWLIEYFPEHLPLQYYYTQLQETRQEDGESPSRSLVQIRAITTKTFRKSATTKLLLQCWEQITITWKTYNHNQWRFLCYEFIYHVNLCSNQPSQYKIVHQWNKQEEGTFVPLHISKTILALK